MLANDMLQSYRVSRYIVYSIHHFTYYKFRVYPKREGFKIVLSPFPQPRILNPSQEDKAKLRHVN